MSWSPHIELEECPHCGQSSDFMVMHEHNHRSCSGYTHNTNAMMRRALRATGDLLDRLGEQHLYALSGMRAGDVADDLGRAVAWWAEQPEGTMDGITPTNGWGDSEGALCFWTALANYCARYPNGMIRMNG